MRIKWEVMGKEEEEGGRAREVWRKWRGETERQKRERKGKEAEDGERGMKLTEVKPDRRNRWLHKIVQEG